MNRLEEAMGRLEATEAGFLIASRRADISATRDGKKAIEAITEELENRLKELQGMYLTINTAQHPNVVIADLARIQGEETQVRDQLHAWKSAGEAKKVLAERVEQCKSEVQRLRGGM